MAPYKLSSRPKGWKTPLEGLVEMDSMIKRFVMEELMKDLDNNILGGV